MSYRSFNEKNKTSSTLQIILNTTSHVLVNQLTSIDLNKFHKPFQFDDF